ncbi:MAG: hypothetical protein ACTSYU_10200 [Promethearchaeota archaeon]
MAHVKSRTIMLALAVVGLVAMLSYVSTASALNNYGTREIAPEDPLVIDEAYYCNLDPEVDDGEDDCVTKFTLYSPTGLEADIRVDLVLSIELPSGLIFRFNYRIDAVFVDLPIEIEWYNVAVEDGWYTFTVSAHMRGTDIDGTRFIGTVSDELVFDPREYRDGALPFAIVFF